jgi:peroxiredoxin
MPRTGFAVADAIARPLAEAAGRHRARADRQNSPLMEPDTVRQGISGSERTGALLPYQAFRRIIGPMKRTWIWAMLTFSSGAFSIGLVSDDPYLAVGSVAPAIAGKATDGKDYALESLAKKGSVFVVFWKERCPHNPRASALFNDLAKAYGDKVKLIGVVPTSPEGASQWVDRFKVVYPLIADSERQFIKDYKLTYSICTFEIGKDGKVANVFGGYGAESLANLNAAMANAAGVDKKEVDLSQAPNRLMWG